MDENARIYDEVYRKAEHWPQISGEEQKTARETRDFFRIDDMDAERLL